MKREVCWGEEQDTSCKPLSLLDQWRTIQQNMIDALGQCADLVGPPEPCDSGRKDAPDTVLGELQDVTASVTFSASVLLHQLRRIRERLQ